MLDCPAVEVILLLVTKIIIFISFYFVKAVCLVSPGDTVELVRIRLKLNITICRSAMLFSK